MNKNNKIAVDIGPLSTGDSVRGIGVYTRELINALKIDGVDVFASRLRAYGAVHFTRFNPFKISVPFNKPKGTKYVLTIYDLIPLIYPAHYPSGIKGFINWQINKYLIRRNIDAIITISETSKKDICRFIGVSPEKVHVIYLAPRSIFKPVTDSKLLAEVQNKFGLPKTFALYVGDVNYNKNIPLLVRSCETAKLPLVIVGKQALEIEKMDLNHPELRHLKGINWKGVVRTGFVSDEDLVGIYNLASVYIQPSLYEGFGLPLLEAQAMGVPVIASRTQALVEIAEGSALFADPKSTKDFAEKITLIVNREEVGNSLSEKGFENVRKYSWDETAKETLKVYK